MTTKEVIREYLTKVLWVGLIGTLGYLLGIVETEVVVPIAQTILPQLSNKGLLAIVCIQFVLLCVAFIIFLLNKNKRKHYRFDKTLGIYFHKKTNEPFCSSCLSHNIESPLQQSKDAWWCGVKDCEKMYRNPDNDSISPNLTTQNQPHKT
jgi:hypothetical protein